MKIFIIDGSADSLFSALFYAFEKKIMPDKIATGAVQRSFTDETFEIINDKEHSERVKKFLTAATTKRALSDTFVALRSGEESKFTIIFNYLKLVTDNKKTDISLNFADERVLNFSDLIRKIYNETHRFKGFLRFSESSKGFMYAYFEPDNDITEFLMPHFKARFGALPFIIHDVKRNIVGLCDGKSYKVFDAKDNVLTVYLSDEEKDFVNLWKTYYKSVNIESRKNTRQMLNYMPARYHKNLPEKQ